MKVTIYGAGYVGLVTGACLADVGNDVLCVDVDVERVGALNRGEIPIYEPDLPSIIQRCLQSGKLRFTTDSTAAVAHGTIHIIAVGTPPAEDGSADLSFVLEVARTIGFYREEYCLVVDKSTVPVGTADLVKTTIVQELERRDVAVDISVASNPEFLKEGDAVNDFMKPDRIVIGTDDLKAEKLLRDLYTSFNLPHDRLLSMDVRSAELTKYAANAMLATKISFMNEMANIAEHVQADIEQVRLGIGSDSRIGFSFINPGCGYGGSCFPKDVRAVAQTAQAHGYAPRILPAVDATNEAQKKVLFSKIQNRLGDLNGKSLAIWGLSFKPNTNDMREAPSLILINKLIKAGAKLRAHDPAAKEVAQKIIGNTNIVFCDDEYEALIGSDALVIITEWEPYREPDFEKIREYLSINLIFDGRNLFEPKVVAGADMEYHAIGRPVVKNQISRLKNK